MFKKYFQLGLVGVTIMFLGCADQTKSLIVFENNIGVKEGILGVYQNSELNSKCSICYEDSKYTLTFFGKNKNLESILEGNFVPSRVEGTKDYYILSFPQLAFSEYNFSEKKLKRLELKNAIVYYKFEKNKLFYWIDFLNEEEEIKNSSEIKKLIQKSYVKTFTSDPVTLFKIGNCLQKDEIENRLQSFKRKYL